MIKFVMDFYVTKLLKECKKYKYVLMMQYLLLMNLLNYLNNEQINKYI